MTNKFIFSPEVSGEMGDNTIVDNRFTPMKVYHLEMVFDRFSDDIFESFPVYIVSQSLYDKIIDLGFTGMDNARLITYEMNEQFDDVYPNGEKPTQNYYMVDITGEADDDFFIDKVINDLVVSSRALQLLKSFRVRYAEVKEYRL